MSSIRRNSHGRWRSAWAWTRRPMSESWERYWLATLVSTRITCYSRKFTTKDFIGKIISSIERQVTWSIELYYFICFIFRRTFSDCQPLSVITENDPLYCIELPQLKEPAEQAYILLVWINVLVKGDLRQRFGSPYTMQVSRETSYEDLQKLLLKEMHSVLADDVLTSSQSPG